METIQIEGKEYEVTGRAEDGLPIIRGIATSTQDGFDAEGNPKISVNINVTPALKLDNPGEAK